MEASKDNNMIVYTLHEIVRFMKMKNQSHSLKLNHPNHDVTKKCGNFSD